MTFAVIGAGAVGCAAARFVVKAGHPVDMFEQFHLDHDRGSSFGPSRIIRRVYPDTFYTALMDDAYRLWGELEEESNLQLRLPTGGIYFGPSDHPDVLAAIDALERARVDYERLSGEEAQERWPAFLFGEDETVLFQADSGVLLASECVKIQCKLAREFGANLKELTRVVGLSRGSRGILVSTDNGDASVYDRVIITAGPWIPDLVFGVPLPLVVTRQQQLFFEPFGDPALFSQSRFPVWIDAATDMYGVPLVEGAAGVKIAKHGLPDIVSPHAVPQEIDEVYVDSVRQYIAGRMPELNGELAYSKVCLYTSTPDEDFVVDQLPNLPGVFIASACSGHGFKFSILIGQLLSELALNPESATIDRFSLRRFRL